MSQLDDSTAFVDPVISYGFMIVVTTVDSPFERDVAIFLLVHVGPQSVLGAFISHFDFLGGLVKLDAVVYDPVSQVSVPDPEVSENVARLDAVVFCSTRCAFVVISVVALCLMLFDDLDIGRVNVVLRHDCVNMVNEWTVRTMQATIVGGINSLVEQSKSDVACGGNETAYHLQ
jgi:hypothetical protein